MVGRQDVVQMQVLSQVVMMTGPKQIFPDQVSIIGRMVTDIGIELVCRLACCMEEDIVIILKK